MIAKFPRSIYEDYPKRDNPGRAEYIEFINKLYNRIKPLELLSASELHQGEDDFGNLKDRKPYLDYDSLLVLPESVL